MECAKGQGKECCLPNETSRGLERESKCRPREHDSRREHCLSKEPRGYWFGKRVLRPNVRADGFGATRFRLRPLLGSCMDTGVLDVFVRKIYCTKLLE